MEQLTDEWFQARCGKITASRISDMVAKTKSGYAATRKNYAAQLITERLTGQKADSYTNAAMQWGIDTEPHARAAYEFKNDFEVVQVGFIDHPSIEMAGASPDGLVGDDGLFEAKCPNTATHIEYLLAGKPPKKYIDQMQWQMACTGRLWCDFVSFDPRLPEGLNYMAIRVERDDKYIAELEAEAIKFNNEINETIKKLEDIKNG